MTNITSPWTSNFLFVFFIMILSPLLLSAQIEIQPQLSTWGGDGFDEFYNATVNPNGDILIGGIRKERWLVALNYDSVLKFKNVSYLASPLSSTSQLFNVKFSSDLEGNAAFYTEVLGSYNFSGTLLGNAEKLTTVIGFVDKQGELIWLRQLSSRGFDTYAPFDLILKNDVVNVFMNYGEYFDTTSTNLKFAKANGKFLGESSHKTQYEFTGGVAIDDSSNVFKFNFFLPDSLGGEFLPVKGIIHFLEKEKINKNYLKINVANLLEPLPNNYLLEPIRAKLTHSKNLNSLFIAVENSRYKCLNNSLLNCEQENPLSLDAKSIDIVNTDKNLKKLWNYRITSNSFELIDLALLPNNELKCIFFSDSKVTTPTFVSSNSNFEPIFYELTLSLSGKFISLNKIKAKQGSIDNINRLIFLKKNKFLLVGRSNLLENVGMQGLIGLYRID
jgi:hypothetical protein